MSFEQLFVSIKDAIKHQGNGKPSLICIKYKGNNKDIGMCRKFGNMLSNLMESYRVMVIDANETKTMIKTVSSCTVNPRVIIVTRWRLVNDIFTKDTKEETSPTVAWNTAMIFLYGLSTFCCINYKATRRDAKHKAMWEQYASISEAFKCDCAIKEIRNKALYTDSIDEIMWKMSLSDNKTDKTDKASANGKPCNATDDDTHQNNDQNHNTNNNST
eukprot:197070_1